MFLNNDFSQMICVHIEIQNNLHKNSELSDSTKFLDRKSNVKNQSYFYIPSVNKKWNFINYAIYKKYLKTP